MPTPAPRWVLLVLAASVLGAAGNVLLYSKMSARLDDLQSQLDQQLHPSDAHGHASLTGAGELATEGGFAPVAMRSSQAAASRAEDRAQRISRLKSAQSPDQSARELDKLFTLEPSLPAVEQASTQALQKAIQSIPSDAPHPVGLQTTCRGRRCLVSAGFADEVQASEWANRLLLMGGKNVPAAARIVAIPLGGGSEGVNLQLYLY